MVSVRRFDENPSLSGVFVPSPVPAQNREYAKLAGLRQAKRAARGVVTALSVLKSPNRRARRPAFTSGKLALLACFRRQPLVFRIAARWRTIDRKSISCAHLADRSMAADPSAGSYPIASTRPSENRQQPQPCPLRAVRGRSDRSLSTFERPTAFCLPTVDLRKALRSPSVRIMLTCRMLSGNLPGSFSLPSVRTLDAVRRPT